MEDKIKQKIEKQSFIIYPIDLKGTGLDWNKALRDEWVKGAEYGYNIKENVNEKLVEALKKIREISLEDFEWAVGSPSMAINSIAKEAILSASNQENNEGWIGVEDRLPMVGKYYLVFDGENIQRALYKKQEWYLETGRTISGKLTHAFSRDNWTEFVTHWMPLPNPPKEK